MENGFKKMGTTPTEEHVSLFFSLIVHCVKKEIVNY